MSRILQAFQSNHASLRRYLARFALGPADVEDLLQETFLRAFAAEGERSIRFPKAFLFRVARNLALNEKNKTAHAPVMALEDSAAVDVIRDDNQTPADEEMMHRQQVRLLAQAVANLPPQCSRVFMLRKVQGLSYKQIAARLNISVSTVEKHVALGLSRCSTYMRQQGYEIEDKNRRDGRDPSAQHTARQPVEIIKMHSRPGGGDV